MRRLFVSAAVLAALFGLSLFSSHRLSALTEQLNALLREAEICVLYEDWDAAADKTEAALDLWLKQETYLHTTLQHKDTDQILLNFHEVRQLLSTQEAGGEYFAANAQLITRIELLSEMEQLNLKNLL